MKETKFDVSGMTCSSCVAHVEKSVSKVPGVKRVQVNLLTNSMTVEYKDEIQHNTEVEKAVEDAGYAAHVKSEEEKATVKVDYIEEERVSTRKRWVNSLYFLLPLLYISMGEMLGLPIPGLISHSHPMTAALLQFMLTIPIYIYNKKYFQTGFKSLAHLAPNMDSLIAIGSGAAIVYGVIQLFRMSYVAAEGMDAMMPYMHDLYFESGATILTLITIGKYLEAKSKSSTSAALEKLVKLRPSSAKLLINNEEMEVAVEQIKVGDIVLVRSGGLIPVDGEIVFGEGNFDESALTGESMPVAKSVAANVYTSAILKTGFVHIRATKVGEDTTLSQIIHLVEEASSSKAPVQKLADKISGIFVPVVIGISIVSFAAWMIAGYSFAFALSIAISVLVISCPCALGLATPVAIMVGTGKAASLGVLFKNATAIEQSDKIDTVVFDKTGTLTEGKPVVTAVIPGAFFPAKKIIEIAASLEKPSEHVLAEAVLAEAEKLGVETVEVEEIKVYEGKGIGGMISGRSYSLGNERLMKELHLNMNSFVDKAKDYTSKGMTPLYLANQTEVLGVLMVADKLKPESIHLVNWLKSKKKEVVMLTGDHKLVAEAIAREAGIDRVVSDVLPADKEGVIRQLQSEGRRVAMVGDGINDAPALTRADLGIAIGSGTDIAIESADVVLLHHKISDLTNVLEIGKTVMTNIKQNLFWAFFYNVAGIPLAAGVFYAAFEWKLNPMFAAAAMSVSSVTVVLNALRINQFKSKFENIEPIKIETRMKTMQVEGMTCGHCKMRVEKALNSIEGVSAEVDLSSGKVSVKMENEVSDADLTKAVTNAGYEVKSVN